MIRPHPRLEWPKDSARLWRYLDFPAFISLLQRQSIYFPRVSVLSDPYEGHFTRPTMQALRAAYGEASSADADSEWSSQETIYTKARETVCCSCWHLSDHESAGMWERYGARGLAITTTFARFRQSFPDHPPSVHAGLVRYIDYETEFVDPSNLLIAATRKRRAFSEERELRAVLMNLEFKVHPGGVIVPVDVSRLSESVHVAPASPAWHCHVVEDLLVSHSLSAPVHHSKLLSSPDYLDRRS